jgi:hypothetical protein
MTTSRIPQVIDYLYNLFSGASTLTSLGVTVLDGPQVNADPGPLALWIGVQNVDAGETVADAATSSQAWAGLGHMARNEELTIFCVVQAKSGSDDVRPLRLQAAAVVSACEDLVRNDASLGGVVSTPGNAAVTNQVWQQGPGLSGDLGMAVRITFEITAQARIGG